MYGNGTRGIRNILDDGRGLPYRLMSDDWFGGWTTAAGGFTVQAQGTEGDDVFVGTDAGERYFGLGGNDSISGGGGRDFLFGDDGDDTIDGDDGNDVIQETGVGNDVIHGGQGDDTLSTSGADGGDALYGDKGDDQLLAAYSVMFGGGGNDLLTGQGSELHGGAGNDTLQMFAPFLKDDYSHEVWGGSGADTFVFYSSSEFSDGGGQLIHDLSNEETIDLSGLDANKHKVGDQAFHLVPEFDGHAKEMTIRYDAEHDRTLIELHTDKDMKPDGTIIVRGDHTDFVNFVF